MIDRPDNGTNTGLYGQWGTPATWREYWSGHPRSHTTQIFDEPSSNQLRRITNCKTDPGGTVHPPESASNPMTEAVTPRKRHRSSYMREYRARQTALRSADGLLPFQSSFVSVVCRKDRPVSIASLEHSAGKWEKLVGGLAHVARSLTPGDPLHEDGVENVLVAASRCSGGNRPRLHARLFLADAGRLQVET